MALKCGSCHSLRRINIGMWPQPLLGATASALWLLIQLVAMETQQHLKGDELKGEILEGSRKRGRSGCSEDEDA